MHNGAGSPLTWQMTTIYEKDDDMHDGGCGYDRSRLRGLYGRDRR